MQDNITQEMVLSTAIIFLLIVLSNPWGIFPNIHLIQLSLGLIILLGVFSISTARQKRIEGASTQAVSDRAAFLTLSGVLLAGIIAQNLVHESSSWLVVALAAGLLAKLIATFYMRRK